MTEYGKAESRLGDEDVAAGQFEAGAGRVGAALVVAGDDGAGSAVLEEHLGAAENMPRRQKRDTDIVAVDRLAIGGRLAAGCKVLAIADRHDFQRFLGGENGGVAGPRMIGVAMGDDGAVNRAGGVDIGARGSAIEALGPDLQPVPGMCGCVGGVHRRKVSSQQRSANSLYARGGTRCRLTNVMKLFMCSIINLIMVSFHVCN